jgi:hypothetical protein
VDAENESLRDLWEGLCFGDAFVYSRINHQQGLRANMLVFAADLSTFKRSKLDY